MSLNHDIAATQLGHQNDTNSDSTAGLAVIALLLALVLGFSAVDLHRRAPDASQQALDAGSVTSLQQGGVMLDGRGKWAGYL